MSICVVDGKHCRCSPSEGSPCPGVVAMQSDAIRQNAVVEVLGDTVARLAKERDELQAKLTESALQVLAHSTQAHEHWEDAQRYQFLRNQPRRKDYYTEEANWSVAREQHGMGQVFRGEELDSQIDAARKCTP